MRQANPPEERPRHRPAWTRLLRVTLLGGMLAVLLALAAVWRVRQSLPERTGELTLAGLQQSVTVRYDERGVPHIRAATEADLYRALGYVHAQDRLFQMEMARRLARGELAEVLGAGLLDTDRLFRTLGLRHKADDMAAWLDPAQPATVALLAYLDGINQFQARGRLPLEFELLGIPVRRFTPQDSLAVTGYLAYSFAAAFRTEPVMTHIRDQLGPAHLRIFQRQSAAAAPRLTLAADTWTALGRVAGLSLEAAERSAMPLFEGSNAWVLAGSRTASGKPLLAGDPHIGFSLPSVWYEAHLNAPGFELYGHHQALSPFAVLGHNADFGWTLTMFQNDDIDLVAERLHPQDADLVWHRGRWVPLQTRTERIAVKGAEPVTLQLRRSPHGPLITEAFASVLQDRPVALWWTFLESDNPILEAFYRLNRADSLARAREAAGLIHAPGLNVLWAHRGGDIGWWAAARLPRRPAGVDPRFILDAARGEADKPGFLPFGQNPQEENPARGYIVSANQAPGPQAPPGYYNLDARAQRLDAALQATPAGWDVAGTQALQQDPGSGYGPGLLARLLPVLEPQLREARDRRLHDSLAAWDGRYTLESTAATVFGQLLYEIADAALRDELPPALFEHLLKTREIDFALPRLLADADSPWWDDRGTPVREDRAATLLRAWRRTLAHLEKLYGADPAAWTWARAHSLTHGHPLGRRKPLDRLLDVGPYAVAGAREVPANFAAPMGPAPWKVNQGPSTRRVIDWGDAGRARGINPVGQSGVPFDRHYKDQAGLYHRGGSAPQHLHEADVAAHTRSTLTLHPAR